MSRSALSWALVVIVITSLAAGCGGGGGGGTTAEEAHASKAWLEQAEPICARFQREVTTITDVSDLTGFISALSQLVTLTRETERALRALGPPAGHEGEFNRMLLALRDGSVQFQQAYEYAKSLDPSAPEIEQSMSAAEDRALEDFYEAGLAALALGSEECGQPAITVVDLEPVNGSGESGTVKLIPIDEGHMKVRIELTNEATRQAGIYIGRCETLGPGISDFSLNDVVDGRSESTIATSLEELRALIHHYSIVVSSGQQNVACGTLPLP
jgi:hypothetical protein